MPLLTCDINPPRDTFLEAWPLPAPRHLSLPLSPFLGLPLPTVGAELTPGNAGECHPDLSSPKGSAVSSLRALPGMGRDCPPELSCRLGHEESDTSGRLVTSDISIRDCQPSFPLCPPPLPPAVLAEHTDLQLTGTGLSTCPPQGQGQYPGRRGLLSDSLSLK